MATKKMISQVEALTAVLAILDTVDTVHELDTECIKVPGHIIVKADLVDKLVYMRDTLIAKRDKPSKAELEKASANEGIMTEIFNTLIELNKPSTISEVQAANTALTGYSTSKMSAMLKKLIDTGKVVRTMDKKKARFSAVPVQ